MSCDGWGASDPLLQSLKCNPEIPQLMFTWIRPVSLHSYSTWPLLPSTSVGICHVCSLSIPSDQVSALFELQQPWAPTCKSRTGISCLDIRSPASYCPPLMPPSPPPLNIFYLFSISPCPCEGWSTQEDFPLQQQNLNRGGQPHICVSKVRLPCRMLSFFWLMAGRGVGWQPRSPWVICEMVWKDGGLTEGPCIPPDWPRPKLSVVFIWSHAKAFVPFEMFYIFLNTNCISLGFCPIDQHNAADKCKVERKCQILSETFWNRTQLFFCFVFLPQTTCGHLLVYISIVFSHLRINRVCSFLLSK